MLNDDNNCCNDGLVKSECEPGTASFDENYLHLTTKTMQSAVQLK